MPVQRGNVEIPNIVFLNAIPYVADNGVLPRVLETLQSQLNVSIDVTALSLDSTSVKVHPEGAGA